MRVLILMSGGYDSLALVHMALDRGYRVRLLHIVYDHPAEALELQACRNIAAQLGLELDVVETSLQAKALSVGVGKKGARIVAGRNAVFVAHAVNVAAVGGCNEVWIGATAEDTGYPDCRPEWIRLQSTLGRPWGVSVEAPAICYTRRQLMQLVAGKGWDMCHAFSCYQPTKAGKACGRCNSCMQGQGNE